eukprot:1902993-Alexandrium_andersonii.AAC.1
MLEPGCRRLRLAGFSNARKRAVLGNSDRTPPWGNPEPMGRQLRWAKVEVEDKPREWELVPDPNGAAPPMGAAA